MTRGNQREIDRQRALNRHASKGTPKAGDPVARREADAKALQDKIARKKGAEDSAGASGGGASSASSGNLIVYIILIHLRLCCIISLLSL